MARWPFRRKSEVAAEQPEYQVPSEIQDYYQAERRERAGVAWLMATGTLVVTILLAVGLFFGGRWIYRKVKGHDSNSIAGNSSVQQKTTDNQPVTPQTSSASTSQPSVTPPASTPAAAAPTPTSPASSAQAATPAPASSSQATANQAGLPNTGPGDVVASVLLATVLGTSVHYLVTNRRGTRTR